MKKTLFAIVLLCPLFSWAADIRPVDVKLGLWENTVTTEIAGMSMPGLSEEQLAKIPPEQRAQVEAMLKGRGAAANPRSITVKACMTRESLNRALYDNNDKSCTTKLVSSTSDSQQIHIDCTHGNTKTSGDLNLERVDAEHVKGSMVMKSTGDSSTGGRSVETKMTFSNKWLSSDCGNVKPAGDKQ